MRTPLSTLCIVVQIVALATFSSGCFFDSSLPISVAEEAEGIRVSISFLGMVDNCIQDTLTQYTCIYLVDGFPHITTVTLVGPAALAAVLLDPLVVQFPANTTEIAGTFTHVDTGTSGNLMITDGLASVDADISRTLTAETGMQLVIMDLPAQAPTTGDFDFTLSFLVPHGTTALDVKPVFTGKVEVSGQTFYPPLLPCVTDLAMAPAVTVPALPDTLTLPPLDGLGCQDVVYDFGGAVAVVKNTWTQVKRLFR